MSPTDSLILLHNPCLPPLYTAQIITASSLVPSLVCGKTNNVVDIGCTYMYIHDGILRPGGEGYIFCLSCVNAHVDHRLVTPSIGSTTITHAHQYLLHYYIAHRYSITPLITITLLLTVTPLLHCSPLLHYSINHQYYIAHRYSINHCYTITYSIAHHYLLHHSFVNHYSIAHHYLLHHSFVNHYSIAHHYLLHHSFVNHYSITPLLTITAHFRTRRVRVNDLLKYRRERELEGVDLASQISRYLILLGNLLSVTYIYMYVCDDDTCISRVNMFIYVYVYT